MSTIVRTASARFSRLLVIALVLSASTAEAAFTREACLAKKRQAQGKLQQCRATQDARALVGKPVDPAKCVATFEERIAQLTEKASKAGITCRFVDNGNSITDYDTGLQWVETNAGDGVMDFQNPQDVDNRYDWTTSGQAANGSAFTDYLWRLNACTSSDGDTMVFAGFAARCDWRLPTPAELATIVDLNAPGCGLGGGCIDPIFGASVSGVYWSSTTDTNIGGDAWFVSFDNGSVGTADKTLGLYVRAVRGGL